MIFTLCVLSLVSSVPCYLVLLLPSVLLPNESIYYYQIHVSVVTSCVPLYICNIFIYYYQVSVATHVSFYNKKVLVDTKCALVVRSSVGCHLFIRLVLPSLHQCYTMHPFRFTMCSLSSYVSFTIAKCMLSLIVSFKYYQVCLSWNVFL